MKKDIVILVAEDDEGHFILTENVLRRAGIDNKIARFTDGQQALDFLFGPALHTKRSTGQKYLLLLDIRMPGINGIEVLEKVKQHEHLSNIPVIMVTTSDDDQLFEHCYKLGCDAHIVKPITPLLANTVKRVGKNL